MNEKILNMAKTAAQALNGKKGHDIKVIKVADKTTLADYLVICNGTSSTQIRALADECEYRLKEAGYEELHREGQPGGDWIRERGQNEEKVLRARRVSLSERRGNARRTYKGLRWA